MKIAIGSDHAGYEMKQLMIGHLAEKGYDVTDFGPDAGGKYDYPKKAVEVGERVAAGEFDRGVLICGTGIGMSIAANKIKGIRAALCGDTFSARMASEHNDANIVCLGARVTGPSLALDILDAYLDAHFDGGRHGVRVGMINDYDKGRE